MRLKLKSCSTENLSATIIVFFSILTHFTERFQSDGGWHAGIHLIHYLSASTTTKGLDGPVFVSGILPLYEVGGVE